LETKWATSYNYTTILTKILNHDEKSYNIIDMSQRICANNNFD